MAINNILNGESAANVRDKLNQVIQSVNIHNSAGYATMQYITNLIANYYLKSQTYSKTEVNSLIANIQGLQFKIIANISEVGDSKFIYLLPIREKTGNNKYSEYLYINGKAELIGELNTSIDLSNYITSGQLSSTLSSYVTSSAFASVINNLANSYVAKEEGKSLIEDTKIAKLDSLPSSVFSQVETQQAINTAIEGVNSAGTRVSFVKEYKNGTLEYIGENGVILQDIYSKMIELKGLPETENEEKIYEISDEPIGNNIYLVIDNITISGGIDVFSSINNDHYKFDIIQETASSIPKLKCTCLITNTKEFTAKIKLSYIKYFGEKVSFSIECASEQEANSLELSIPKLKFNKEAIISLTADDASASHYCALFNYINNRPYSLGYFFHHNQYDVGDLPKADAAHPDDAIFAPLGKTLGFTDGCGIGRRITFDCAIWAHATSGENIMMDWIINVDPSANNQYRFMTPFLVWGDLIPMFKFGCSISQHNVDTPERILSGYIADNTKALTKLGRGFKILTRPDGNNAYVNVSLDFPQHLAIIGENAPTVFQYPFSEDFDMYKILQQRRFPSEATDYITEVIESEMLLPKEQRRWMHSGIHRAGQTSLDYVLWLNNNLGKDGSDVAWITTPDEFYEYWYMRKYSKVIKNVVGTTAKFEVYIPKGQYFYYPELTFISNQPINLPTNIHDKIKGFSFNETNMFNINLDANLVSLAEKYTARFEANQLPIDKQDALYFANQLRVDLKTPFLLRIDAVENVPLESLSISGGNITNLLIGETTQLTAVFTPSGTAQTNIEWSVNDEAIATVDSNGLVTCVGAGQLIVTLQSLDNPEISTTKNILCVASRPITGIAISGESNGIVDDTIQLTATLTPSNTTETGILWESNNNSIAHVSETGLVTLKSVGTVKITAKSLSNELVYDELIITVAAEAIPVVSITVNGTTPIEVGNTEQFSVTYNPTNTTEVGVVWTSSNQNVATVNSSGLVTAIGTGTATIIATSIHRQDVAGTQVVTITPQVIAITGLTITGGTTVDNGNTLQLGIAYTPSNTTQQGVTWSSSDLSKATVNSSGLVTAITGGDVVITATSAINGAISDTHNITINEVTAIPLTDIMMTGVVDRRVGKNYQMPYSLTPSDTTETGLIWSSSNTAIATIDNTGLITPLSAGVTTITVKSASNQSVLHTKRLEVFATTTNPVYKISGVVPNAGNILYIEEQGEYATPNNYKGETSSGFDLKIRNAITGEDMSSLGFSKMSSTQKIAAFGSAGKDTLSSAFQNPPYLDGSPAYRKFTYGGKYGVPESVYIGQNVPNGTYNIKWLMAAEVDSAFATSGTTLNINGTNIPITIENPNNNETWMDCGNIVVSDAKLKISFACEASKYFGWNGILVEKIA